MGVSVSIALLVAGAAVPTLPNAKPADWMWGITVDNLDEPVLTAASIKSLPKRATVRLVFDPSAGPEYYRESTRTIHHVAQVMGEPIDSALTKRVSREQYRDRMLWYMEELRGLVDIWEVGNEVNGDWGGESTDVAAKIESAYDEAVKRKLPTALTVFYSDHYVGTDREMSAWSGKYLPQRVRDGIDYVLVSFYPQKANGTHPKWSEHFRKLANVFPHAKLGFGELGLANADYTLNSDLEANRTLIRRYYGMRPPIPSRYIGGYFWWSFRQDAVPQGHRLWDTFREVMARR